MVATSGARLINEDAVDTLKKRIVFSFGNDSYSKYSGGRRTWPK